MCADKDVHPDTACAPFGLCRRGFDAASGNVGGVVPGGRRARPRAAVVVLSGAASPARSGSWSVGLRVC